MKERPILFSAPMVRALLDGTKTQTRRLFGPERMTWPTDGRYETHAIRGGNLVCTGGGPFIPNDWIHYCPAGQSGDRLWVREAWTTHACFDHLAPRNCPKSIHYMADGEIQTGKGRPSIHMPRWASRIDLEVTGVGVERLQDISDDDAIAEGIEKTSAGFWSLYGQADTDGTYSARASFRALWESLNGAGSWNANPWVWVIIFKRIGNAEFNRHEGTKHGQTNG